MASGIKQPRRLDSEADALRAFLQQVGSYTTDLIFGVHAGKGLYHYTDLGGLQGIVSKSDLWLTDSRYSNGAEEMRHGYGIAKTVLDAARIDASNHADQPRVEYLDKIAELLAKPPSEAVYISCFCLEENLLSQWRGYGGTVSGVCVEFEPPMFSAVTGPDSPSKGLMRLWKVFYDVPTQKNIVKEALEFGYHRPGSLDERARYATDAIFFFVPTFKHNDFHEEQECRLIFTPPPDCPVNPRFRVGRGMLVPYYSLHDLTAGSFRLPIKRVVVGPAPHKQINASSIEAMLATNDYDGVPVEMSGTPFRL
jgi:hypothetical protein